MITSKELREKYFEFFKDKGHALIPSASLVPENDPTVLYTTAGMHPLVPYLLGEKHPGGKRLVNAQKCIRTGDIDEVGDATHLTFFEMLGNWSLGDYFKKEMIPWSWEFLTDKKWIGIEPERIFVSVYKGDDNIPKDEESIELWQKQFEKAGIRAKENERIFPLGIEDNWWGPAGETGPCGPDTEMFFDTKKPKCGLSCKPGCSCGKYVEIWNDVFMEYNKRQDGSYEKLGQKNVDTGMGLERTLAVFGNCESVFETELFVPIIKKIREISKKDHNHLSSTEKISERIVADHVKAAVFIISDGVNPSNIERGYILRRLIRRAIRHGLLIGSSGFSISVIAEEVFKIYGDAYLSLLENKKTIIEILAEEEEKFAKTLSRGIKRFNELIASEKAQDRIINSKDAFDLFQSFGFPIEMTKEMALENGLGLDEAGFYSELKKHQDLSRNKSGIKFKGGLADNSEITTKYHTATHLLHSALREVLGSHVGQKGSNINSDRLRFDFSHPEKMTDEELKKVEDLVNSSIKKDYKISFEEMTPKEAKDKGAVGLFDEKYSDKIKMYSVGDSSKSQSAGEGSECFSKEICGGPHAKSTGDLGKFKIIKEQSASAGVRRIKAVLE